MKKYYKKSDTFTAIKFDGENMEKIAKFIKGANYSIVKEHAPEKKDDGFLLMQWGGNVRCTSLRVGDFVRRAPSSSKDENQVRIVSAGIAAGWVEIHDEPTIVGELPRLAFHRGVYSDDYPRTQ